MNQFLVSNNFIKAKFLSYGAILHELWVKNYENKYVNVIKGLKKKEEYLNDIWSRGAIMGRYAGRLENPILIEGKKYEIENKNGVLLHSGLSGWNKKNWKVINYNKHKGISFEYLCKDGSSGFPGNVIVKIKYALIENELQISYLAETDKNTHINLTNHSYFNLNGNNPINSNFLKINADCYLELKNNLVPSGKILNVSDTKFDFRNFKVIGTNQFDDYFILNKTKEAAASIYNPNSKIKMEVYTNQPGIVIFTPLNFEGICFETQKFSNSPNISHFPKTLLKTGEVYEQKTKFRFSLIE
mgnify:FL=1